jgi:HK97 family phage prohead protease
MTTEQTFDGNCQFKLQAQVWIEAAEGEGRRTISGIAAPYGVEATVTSGEKIRIEAGALPTDGKAPKLFMYHDSTQPVGIVTERVETEQGMLFSARIAATAAGNEALTLAQEGVLDSVSVGINPTQWAWEGDTMIVKAAEWVELSLVPIPAFAGATITDIAASIHHKPKPLDNTLTMEPEKEQDMTEQVETPQPIEASTVAHTVFAQPRAAFKLPSAAEYVAAFLQGGATFDQLHANVRAAAPDVLTSDTPGILPEEIVANVYNNFQGRRPVVDAIGVRAMPSGGKIFRRPSVTTHTTIGVSNGENVDLDDGTFVVTDNQVTKKVFGGYVRLSEEDMEWTSPEVMGLLLDDMSRVYANATDNEAADELIAGATVTQAFALANIADPSYWITWIAQASSAILTGSNGNIPTHLFVAPGVWEDLVALSDSSDRPLFPQIGPMNAFGQVSASSPVAGNAFGLQVVVDRNFAGGGTMVLGDASGFECYERQYGAISVEAADGSLSRYIKFRGQFATLMIDNTKFRKAAFA